MIKSDEKKSPEIIDGGCQRLSPLQLNVVKANGWIVLIVSLTVLVLIILILTISSSSPAKANILNENTIYSEILGKIKNTNCSFFWDEPRYPEILQLPDDLLESFVRRRKPTFSKFEEDLLFTKVARDKEYTYSLHVEFEYSSPNFKKCILSKDKNDLISKAKECRNEVLSCLGKSEVSDVSSSTLEGCLNKNGKCSDLKKLDSGSPVSIEYCEKLYGRKL